MPWWWPFSKKRDERDIAEARLLEHAKNNIEGVIAYLHKTNPAGRIEAIKEAQSALGLFVTPPRDITNPKHIQENKNLKYDIESLVIALKDFEKRQRGSGFITQAYKDSMKALEANARRIIEKINGILRQI